MVGYLRWKFRLISTGLWSVRNVSWVDPTFISMVCKMFQWDTTSWYSVVIQVLKHYAVEKAKERVSRRHEICVWSSSGVGIYVTTTETNTPVQLFTFLRRECNWVSTGRRNIGIHILAGISGHMEISKGATPSSIPTGIFAAIFVILFIFEVRIPPTVTGGEILMCGLQFRFVLLTSISQECSVTTTRSKHLC